MRSEKEEAKKLIDTLPDSVNWDDIIYEMYVKKKIAEGLDAIEHGRVLSHEEAVKRIFEK